MNERLADFYIIGAMKCATSTLHEQLACREAFFMTEPKEPNFFNDDALYPVQFGWYKGLFRDARVEQICGESSTHYTKFPTYQGTAQRIHEHTPEARLVYVMRDPVERLVSHYIHEWTEGRARGDISQAVLSDDQFVAYSSYARQLKEYMRFFDKSHILPVFFECLTNDRAGELERVARFLGDPGKEPFLWHKEVQQTNVSKDRMRKSAIRDALLSLEWGRRVKDALPTNLKDKIKSFWQMRDRPTLNEEALEHVRQVLGSDLRELSSMLGVEFTLDSFKEKAKVTRATFI